MGTFRALFVAILLSLGTLGCAPCLGVPCPSCPSAIRVRTMNGPLTNLSAEIPTLQQAASCDATECTFFALEEAGSFDVVVAADGFQTQTVLVNVPESIPDACCGCGYLAQVVEVTLQP